VTMVPDLSGARLIHPPGS